MKIRWWSQLQKSWVPVVVLSVGLSVALVAFAQGRKVSVALNSGSSLELANGSNVPVSYTVTCYGSANGVAATNITNTLGARGYTSYYFYSGASAHVGCTYTNAAWTSSDLRLVFCYGSASTYVPYASAASVCNASAGYSLCSTSQLLTFADYTNSWATGWVNASSFASGSYSNYMSPGYTDFDGTTAPVYASNASSYCATSTGGAGTPFAHCEGYPRSNYYPAACCASVAPTAPWATGDVRSCDVEISSDTSAEGFLQSPQFKANAPF